MQRNAHVVGIDFSEMGDLALDGALGVSADSAGELHAVHVIPALTLPIASELGGEIAARQIEARLDGTGERLKSHVEERVARFAATRAIGLERIVTHVRVGGAAECIAALAAEVDADLVVVGTRGRRGVSRLLLGSVAELTTRLARCPVLVVRPKHHEISADARPVPEIEPPCPRCVRARAESRGARMWCEQHSQRHDPAHRYHYTDRTATEVSLPLVFPMR